MDGGGEGGVYNASLFSERKLIYSCAQGAILDPSEPVEKVYNVKHVLSSTDTTFSVELFAHDPASEPATEGWMTDLKGERFLGDGKLGVRG